MNSTDRNTVENLDTTSRVLRAVTGAGLILYTMSVSVTPLGWLAVLPLLAIYPMFTAITGWSPMRALFKVERNNGDSQFSTTARVSLGVVGAAAIGSVYVVSGPLGGFAVLPLLGIYPVFLAIIGCEPFSTLTQSESESSEETAELQVITSTRTDHHAEDYQHAA